MTVRLHPRALSVIALLGWSLIPACEGPTFDSSNADAGTSNGGSGSGSSGASGKGSSGGAAPGAGTGGDAGRGTASAGRAGQGDAGKGDGGASAGNLGEGGAGESGDHQGGADSSGGTGATGGVGAAGAGANGAGGGVGGNGAAGAGGTSGGLGGIGGLGGALAGLGGTPIAGAASGGASGTAGNAGGGTGGTTVFCSPAFVVDDMEDGNDLTCPNQGRSGDWWTATGTTTGTINPPSQGNFPAAALGADARAGSNFGMRLAGQNFGTLDSDWASLGFYLAGGGTYNLSSYQGLAFYAKTKGGTFEIHVKFAMSPTTPVSEGGMCLDDCNDHFRSKVVLGTTWQQFMIPLGTLEQEGWGQKPKDLTRSLFVYFGVLGAAGGPASFEFLVDDVRLY